MADQPTDLWGVQESDEDCQAAGGHAIEFHRSGNYMARNLAAYRPETAHFSSRWISFKQALIDVGAGLALLALLGALFVAAS